MAAGSLSKPGTQSGPCAGPCLHRDCATWREVAAALCPLCGESIGDDRRFFGWLADGHEPPTHADCAWDQAEREAAR